GLDAANGFFACVDVYAGVSVGSHTVHILNGSLAEAESSRPGAASTSLASQLPTYSRAKGRSTEARLVLDLQPGERGEGDGTRPDVVVAPLHLAQYLQRAEPIPL